MEFEWNDSSNFNCIYHVIVFVYMTNELSGSDSYPASLYIGEGKMHTHARTRHRKVPKRNEMENFISVPQRMLATYMLN